MYKLFLLLAVLSSCRPNEKNAKNNSIKGSNAAASSLISPDSKSGQGSGLRNKLGGNFSQPTTTTETEQLTEKIPSTNTSFKTVASSNHEAVLQNCDPYNDVVPIKKEKVAILYLVPNDLPETWKLTKNELTDHFFTPCVSPLKKFWSEVSHGKYQYTGDVFVQNFSTKSAVMNSPKFSVRDMLFDLAPNSDLTVSGLDPTQYDTLFFFVASNEDACREPQPNMCHFGGGFITYYGDNSGASPLLKINGIPLSTGFSNPRKTISFVYFGNKNPARFEFYDPNQPFNGKGNGNSISYPELGLWSDDYTTLHEWGHSIGLYSHASYYFVDQEPLGGYLHFTNVQYATMGEDYGNYFDIMGAPMGRLAMHFNAGQQDKLGWFNDDKNVITSITSSQQNVTISPLEGNGVVRAAVVSAPGTLNVALNPDAVSAWGARMAEITVHPKFYIEYRQPFGFDKNLSHPYVVANIDGLFIHLSIPNLNATEYHTYLLNMGPIGDGNVVTSNGYYKDHHLPALLPGKRFYNASSGILIRNVRSNGSVGATFDVVLGNDIPQGIPEGVSNE